MDHQTSTDAAASFVKDDLEFRTVTTLLSILKSSGQISLDNFGVPQHHRRHLKLLVSLSSLLVREHEIVAVMAKKTVSGTTFVLGSNSKEEEAVREIPDDVSTSSTSSSDTVMSIRSHYNLLTQNPRFGSPPGPVQLLSGTSEMKIGSDVFQFILQHWFVDFPSSVHDSSYKFLVTDALLQGTNRLNPTSKLSPHC